MYRTLSPVVALLSLALSMPIMAQGYPSKPIKAITSVGPAARATSSSA